MSPKRDFTSTVKDTLEKNMQDIAEEDEKYWFLPGLIDNIQDLFIAGDIASYEGDIQAYHRSILDKKNTSKEQQKILQTFFDELQIIMGTNADHTLLFGTPMVGNEQVDALYSSQNRDLTLNKDLLMDASRREYLLQAIVHETRHAYQAEAVYYHMNVVNNQGYPEYTENGHIVSDQTRNSWLNNFNNPIDPSVDYDAYRRQANEWDANSFAGLENSNYEPPEYAGSWKKK